MNIDRYERIYLSVRRRLVSRRISFLRSNSKRPESFTHHRNDASPPRFSNIQHGTQPPVRTNEIWIIDRKRHPRSSIKKRCSFFLNYRQQELYSTADESNLFETIQDACGSTRPNPIPRSRPRKPVESYKSQAQRFERIVSFLSVMRFLADGVTLSRVEDGSTKFNRTPSPRSFRFYIGRGKRGLVGCARCKSPVPLFSVYLSVLSAWFIGRPFHLVVGGIKRGRKRRGGGIGRN